MAKYPETTVTNETTDRDGSKILRVGFLKPPSKKMYREVDPRFGTRLFRITSGAIAALDEANDQLTAALESIGGRPQPRVQAMDASMAVFLYTRRIEPHDLPSAEIFLDEITVRSLLKKHLSHRRKRS